MKEELSAVLRTPDSHETLQYIKKNNREFLKRNNGALYEIDHDIIRFLKNKILTGNNRFYQKLYDNFAPFYNTATRVFALIKSGGEEKRVMQYLSELEIKNGNKVLEISIGTGRNIRYLNPNAVYYGADISINMLGKCRSTLRALKRDFVLIEAEAERLPLKDDTFDAVFSSGGFNFFNDKTKAVLEMLRIAKSGTKLLISDETEKIRTKYKKTPVAGWFYNQEQIINPIEFIPGWCRNIQYKEICGGELYVLTFRKP